MYLDYNSLSLSLSGVWENSIIIVYTRLYFVPAICQQRRAVSNWGS
jgi:hypothetical protein